jgi:alpha-1,3-glucosyltransferase
MATGALNRKTFLFYLAACNFIVFNFGFHVHEKAILMTIIPLALDTHQGSTSWAKLRFVLLKTIAVWTLLPLLISPGETLVKHLILIIDYLVTVKVLLKLEVSSLPMGHILHLD